MSTSTSVSGRHPGHPRPGPLAGRGGLIVPVILVLVGVFLVVGNLGMEGPGGVFGPKAFPWIVAALCFLVAAFLVVDVIRHPERPAPVTAIQLGDAAPGDPAGASGAPTPDAATHRDPAAEPDPAAESEPVVEPVGEPARERANWPCLAGTVGGVAFFALTLEFLGWVIAATVLFWAVTTGLGSRRHVVNLVAGLGVASLIQVVFSGVLGLSLPPGLLGRF